MGFTETIFLFVFLPFSIILYILIDKIFHRDNVNNLLLVIMSLFFYYWADKKSLLIFVIIVLFSYMAGYLVRAGSSSRKGKLVFGLVCVVGLLVFYKYYAFICTAINRLAGSAVVTAGDLIVPIGLSFTVFEAVSYIVDIYREDAEPGNLLTCFTFFSLFPKLVSGPIVLWKDFSTQLVQRRTSLDRITAGIDRIIIGYAKKVIIADSFGAHISLINTNMSGLGVDVPTMWLRAILYFFQLYIDFSGYSDIAIGLCSIFGFSIKENFNFPYLSKSITEFWRRWHISLGTWFREYVYIPMGGNRKGNVYFHLAVVFILTGLWHGSGLTYLIWGAIHALFVIIERFITNKNWYKKIPAFVKWAFTNLILFFSWIIFMSGTIDLAVKHYKWMLKPMADSSSIYFTWRYYFNTRIIILLLIAALSYLFGLKKINSGFKSFFESYKGRVIKRILLIVLFAVDIVFVVNSSYSPFIYFQF